LFADKAADKKLKSRERPDRFSSGLLNKTADKNHLDSLI
jgi:hypothetical protein